MYVYRPIETSLYPTLVRCEPPSFGPFGFRARLRYNRLHIMNGRIIHKFYHVFPFGRLVEENG